MPAELEIGCGHVRRQGVDHLDLRPLEHVRYVQDASDLSNIASDTYDVVSAHDVIEHISWRVTVPTLREWLRVLKPGGKLIVGTPNALELIQILVNPYHPNYAAQEPRFVFFNRVCFGDQDCPENAHLAYFTPEWLTDLLYRAGARSVRVVEEDVFRFTLEATRE